MTDHAGTPYKLIDSEGKTIWEAEADDWGAVRNEKGVRQPIRFQGQYHDEETGLYYNRFRYYDPLQGRYITQDPIGLLGGMNNFIYPMNSVEWVDPLGLQATDPTWGLGGYVNSPGVQDAVRQTTGAKYTKNICEALHKLAAQKDNLWIKGCGTLKDVLNESSDENSLLGDLGLGQTIDGVDFQYVLVVNRSSRTKEGVFTGKTADLGTAAFLDYFYIPVFSRVTATRDGDTSAALHADMEADAAGVQMGMHAGAYPTFQDYANKVCPLGSF
jgi:RHS repeat-associated protein